MMEAAASAQTNGSSPNAIHTNGDNPVRVLTAAEVAHKLGTTTRWVYAETRAGRIPHVRLGPRYVRYVEASIDAWLLGLERGAPGLRPGGFPHG